MREIKTNLLSVLNPNTGIYEQIPALRGIDGKDGYIPIKGVDYYTAEEQAEWSEYIASELAKRGQLKPEFANSIEECTDQSKLYVLPDGYIYAYIKTVTEGETVPNFTNLMEKSDAFIRNGERYSFSGQGFQTSANDCAVVVPITTASAYYIRVRGATFTGCDHPLSVYLGVNSQLFAGTFDGGSASNFEYGTSDNDDLFIHIKNPPSGTWNYIVFHVAPGVDASELIVTVNEEITYTTAEGGISYAWANTGHAFVPADYEDRIVAVEEQAANNALKISELENNSGDKGVPIEFVDSVEECVDQNKLYVLPDGSVYAYKYTAIDIVTPDFTNLIKATGAYYREGERYSRSNNCFYEESNACAIVIPIPSATTYTIRVRGATMENCSYPDSVYFGDNTTEFLTALPDENQFSYGHEENGDVKLEILRLPSEQKKYMIFHVAHITDKEGLIVTINEEITYTTTEDVTGFHWTDTGYSLITESYTTDLENRLENIAYNSSGATVFATPAYAPTPQLPADGSEGSDFDYHSVTTQDAYDYMDALCGKYTQYITKQTMGKDASGAFDHNRYILSKAYWRAWQKENYPRMFAWINGSTVIYSVSVSPRVGDTMYSTPYIGAAYSTVTVVNSAAHTASTRTVNGLVFTRHAEGDIEPTIVYTKPPAGPGVKLTVYNSSYASLTTSTTIGDGYIIGADGVMYYRYPFEDRRQDKSKPLSIFILSNEHGNYGDDQIPSYVVMRMAKDLCKNIENPFLKWLKENCMITMIPVGNPWGYARYLESTNTSGYYNSNGVNINRNYDTPGWSTSDTNYGETETFGAYPGSEAETQNIMNTMQLCKPAVGISMHSPGFAPQFEDMPDNAYFIYQGKGFDAARVHRITEVLYSNYGMGGSADVGAAQSYENCGKSPAYIQYVGAVGGLTETVTQENGTNNTHTSLAMEQAYTQMLMFLQLWCEEALKKRVSSA